jgi:hypothetical protein
MKEVEPNLIGYQGDSVEVRVIQEEIELKKKLSEI